MNKDLFHIFKTLVCNGHADKEEKDYPHKLQLWCNNLYDEARLVVKAIDTALEETGERLLNQQEFLIRQGRFLLFLEKAIPHHLSKPKRYLVKDCIYTVFQHLDNRFQNLSKSHNKGLLATIKELDTACEQRQIQQILISKEKYPESGHTSYRQQSETAALMTANR